jgi:ribonuclease Z
MSPLYHNALHTVTLQAAGYTLEGFSISGLATWLIVKELDVLFDLGECPLEAVPVGNVFLTHIHGDHSRCLLRHWELRDMLGMGKVPIQYIVPVGAHAGLRDIVQISAKMEGIEPKDVHYPNLQQALRIRMPFLFRKELWSQAFAVEHRVESYGYTIGRTVQKLKAEYSSLSGAEIGALRKGGTEVTDALHTPLVTFIGDCTGATLTREAHIWDSKLLILECTYVEDEDQERAIANTHTHLRELIEVLKVTPAPACEALVLKHFSMRDKPARIRQLIAEQLPENWKNRVHILLPPEDS